MLRNFPLFVLIQRMKCTAYTFSVVTYLWVLHVHMHIVECDLTGSKNDISLDSIDNEKRTKCSVLLHVYIL